MLGRDRKTNEWFGDYVSEYNFSQSTDDGATVPLFYKKRVPEVLIQNEDLSDELMSISALTGEGVNQLVEVIARFAKDKLQQRGAEPSPTSARQRMLPVRVLTRIVDRSDVGVTPPEHFAPGSLLPGAFREARRRLWGGTSWLG